MTEEFDHVLVSDGCVVEEGTRIERSVIGVRSRIGKNVSIRDTVIIGADKFEIAVPSVSIVAEPPVTVIDKVVDKHGTRAAAQAYLEYLYSPAGQKIAAKHYYRPSKPESVDAETMKQFPKIELFTVKEVFGSWREAHEKRSGARQRHRHVDQLAGRSSPDLEPDGRSDGDDSGLGARQPGQAAEPRF